MAIGNTTNYGWIKPNIGDSLNVWGSALNTDLDGIDSVVGVINTEVQALIAQGTGGGAQNVFQSVADIRATLISGTVGQIVCLAYAVPGDLRGDMMQFSRVGSMPTFPGFVQSADGAFWQLNMDEVNVFMFGALGIGDSAHDDWPAIRDAILYCNGRVTVPTGDGYGIPPTLIFPPTTGYYSSQTIAITTPMRIIGSDLGEGHFSVPIQFPAGVTGMTIAYSTAVAVYLSHLCLVGVTDTTNAHAMAHGFVINNLTTAENCCATLFSGNGWLINGVSGGPVFGFTDQSTFRKCFSNGNGRHGFQNGGADANVCIFEQCSASSNAGWGYRDEGEFSNKYDSCLSDGNGWPANATGNSDSLGPSVIAGGVVYTAVGGIQALTGTPLTATTTPGTNSAVWIPTNAAASIYYSAYVPGGIYREGGDFFSGGGTHMFINCYCETGPAFCQIENQSLSIGGTMSPFPTLNPLAIGPAAGALINQGLQVQAPFSSAYIPLPGSAFGTETVISVVGNYNTVGGTRFVRCSASGDFIESVASGDMSFASGVSSGFTVWTITGANTALKFGTASAQPAVFMAYKLGILGSNGGNNIVHLAGNSLPTGGGDGWVQWNNQPFLGEPFAWQRDLDGVWLPLMSPVPPCAVASLPPGGGHPPTQGARGMVTDATVTLAAGIGNAPTGGGSHIVPVYYDGTNWLIG